MADLHSSIAGLSKMATNAGAVGLVITECITISSAMRKHSKWANSSVTSILSGAPHVYRQNSSGLFDASGPSEDGPQGSYRQTGNGINPDAGEYRNWTSQWRSSGKMGEDVQNSPLISAFARLRSDLGCCPDIRTFDVPSLLHPFLQVIRSSSTSASITNLALIAITKFFSYNFITDYSPRLFLGIQRLSAAVTHCRFEASDSAADEIVLLRILKLMETILSGPGGNQLSDESLCNLLETGLSMCCQQRLTELLRRSAELSMVGMCQVVFQRLNNLEGDNSKNEVAAVNSRTNISQKMVKIDASSMSTEEACLARPSDPAGSSAFDEASHEICGTKHCARLTPKAYGVDIDIEKNTQKNTASVIPGLFSDSTLDDQPYSLPAIREIFRVLINLSEPHDSQRTDAVRLIALKIIHVALEVAGPSIAIHSSLALLARNDLCRNLFQLIRSDNTHLVNESLTVSVTLLVTCRGVLKLQQEWFLSYLLNYLHSHIKYSPEPSISPILYDGVTSTATFGKQSPLETMSGGPTPVPAKDRRKHGGEGATRRPDVLEAMVESLGSLARIPSFLVELFVNYDCDVDRMDLFEELIGLFTRNALPDSATWTTQNIPLLCLDALLGYLQFIANRVDDPSAIVDYPNYEELRRQRDRKKVVIEGASKFNENPPSGIAYLVSRGVIGNPDDPFSIVRFLKETSRVSRKVLGEYISKKSNDHLLRAFLRLFDFTNKRLDQALREFLGTFRLPGEAPLIERIVTVFAERFCANSTPDGITSKDSVYVLTYATIMLNTDQHNPNVKTQNRMSSKDFARNLRGVNGGKDFASDYLQSIYDSIRTNEIILPAEHDNKDSFDFAWKILLTKAQNVGDLAICNSNSFDADMFTSTWKPVVTALSCVFISATEDVVIQRVAVGFDHCAQIAAAYNTTEALDQIIYCLASITTLATSALANTTLNTEVLIAERRVMVSELAVRLGRDVKAQLATIVLFKEVIAGNESKINKGWMHIIRIWLNLFVNSLIPSAFSQFHSYVDIPPIPIQAVSQIISRGELLNESGIFQNLTSYLSSYATNDPPEPSDEELSDTLRTVDLLSICSIDDILSSILRLSAESTKVIVQELLCHLPPTSSPAVITVKSDSGLSSSAVASVLGLSSTPSNYDPKTVYILELSVMIAIQSENSGVAVEKDVAEALQGILRDANTVHPLLTSRAVFYLLLLLNHSHDHSVIRVPLVFHAISSLDTIIIEQSASLIVRGLTVCMQGSYALKNEIVNTPGFWSTLRSLYSVNGASGGVFLILEGILSDTPSAVTADNYGDALYLLNHFATAASIDEVVEEKGYQTMWKSEPAMDLPAMSSTVSRGVRAVDMIYQLKSRVGGFIEKSHLERHKAQATYWLPIFSSLGMQSINPGQEIRFQAMSNLQRVLLSSEFASTDYQEWTNIFEEVLFPLLFQLLKPQIHHSDRIEMSRTRAQAVTLICRVFLHCLFTLSEWDQMLDIWLKLLDVMDRLTKSGYAVSLEEAILENLKNILLVMANSGYLVPPVENPRHVKVWEETWKRLEASMPHMFREVFPGTAQLRKAKTTP